MNDLEKFGDYKAWMEARPGEVTLTGGNWRLHV